MRFGTTALLLVPLFLVAQEPKSAPPDVDKALRARVTTFLQYQVEGNFRKAYDLVAEDTKDFYFSIAKTTILSFTIGEITYSDGFSKATVQVTTTRKVNAAGYNVEIPSVGSDTWKLEDGKWVWYHDTKSDSGVPFFGGLVGSTASQTPAAAVDPKLLPKDTSPQAVAAAAANLIQPTSFDKSLVAFTQGKAGVEEVIFHNGNRGQVKVSAWVEGSPEGITVEPVETFVNALGDLKLRVHYSPEQTAPRAANVRFEVQPFRTMYVLPVTITPEKPEHKQ